MFILTFVLLAAAFTVNGQYISPGKCPTPRIQQHFNFTAFSGKYYQISAYPQKLSGPCATADYEKARDGVLTYTYTALLDGKYQTRHGVATQISSDGSADFEVVITAGNVTIKRPYKILVTNYEFALVYSCVEVGPNKDEFTHLMSREQTLSAAGLAGYNNYISHNKGIINPSKMLTTDQSKATCGSH